MHPAQAPKDSHRRKAGSNRSPPSVESVGHGVSYCGARNESRVKDAHRLFASDAERRGRQYDEDTASVLKCTVGQVGKTSKSRFRRSSGIIAAFRNKGTRD